MFTLRQVQMFEAVARTGGYSKAAEELGVSLSALEPAAFREEHGAFGGDVPAVFDWIRSVDSRDSEGGTSRRSVMGQIEVARIRLKD